MCGNDLTFQSQKMIDVIYGDVWSKFSALSPLPFTSQPYSNNSNSSQTTTTTKKLFSYLMFFDEHLMAIHFPFPHNMQIPLVYFKLCAATQHNTTQNAVYFFGLSENYIFRHLSHMYIVFISIYCRNFFILSPELCSVCFVKSFVSAEMEKFSSLFSFFSHNV